MKLLVSFNTYFSGNPEEPHEQGDGNLFYGVSIQNGRIKDAETFKLKTLFRVLVEQFDLPMILTPSQNVILYDIKPTDTEKINQLLQSHGINQVEEIDPLVRTSMSCPALPTCGLATAESKRIIPNVLIRLRELLIKVGLSDESFIVRMTGCPNGCARPYLAELAFIGNGSNIYQVWLGAAPNQTRLAKVYLEKMNLDDLEVTFEPIFRFFKAERELSESFGDFCERVGLDLIRSRQMSKN